MSQSTETPETPHERMDRLYFELPLDSDVSATLLQNLRLGMQDDAGTIHINYVLGQVVNAIIALEAKTSG